MYNLFLETFNQSKRLEVLILMLTLIFSSCAKFDTPVDEEIIVVPALINVISSDRANSIQEIMDDMTRPHEGIPHGVPTNYDWYSNPVVHNIFPQVGYFYLTNWGQLYENSGNKAKNTRVQIKNLKTYYLSIKDEKWVELQTNEPIDGKLYSENQDPKTEESAYVKNESEGISATAGSGRCFHWWSRRRALIDPTDIGGVFTTCEARLIVSDSNPIDDKSLARYVLDIGGDYWQNASEGENASIGMGRFKYVKTGWQSFNFTTLPASTLIQNPPPFNQ